MNYLGGLRGTGLLLCADERGVPAWYDFDGYLSNTGQVTSCGEIRLPASVLKEVFGRADLQLRTAEGLLLRLRFSEKRLSSADGAAHVDVEGDLPAAADWHRRSERMASVASVRPEPPETSFPPFVADVVRSLPASHA